MPLAFGIPMWGTLADQMTYQTVNVLFGNGYFMSIFDIDVHVIIGFHEVWYFFRILQVPLKYFESLCSQSSVCLFE